MSFTRLLAASRSVMGIKKEPGPYKMNQDHLLPKFAPVEKLAGPELEGEDTKPAVDMKAAVKSRGRTGGWLSRLGGKVARLTRRGRKPAAATAARRLVQGELLLDAVRVVRNDLKDSDFEVVSGRGNGDVKKGAGQQIGMVWNRLTARLLRQAVQDFNLVQKQRGKLLSQAGDGGGSAGST